MSTREYQDFVSSVMSEASSNTDAFVSRIVELGQQGFSPAAALTAAIGLPGEAGEFSDLVKKVVFQGKPYTAELRDKMESELADIMWYVAAGCIAMGTDIDSLIARNSEKLKARYPDGFSVEKSENRKSNDY